MGILISRFRRKPSTKELLEQIEQELEEIEDFRFSTQQHQRRWIGRLIIFSVITYLTGALLFFLYFFPSELSKQILYSLPLFIFPLIVYALKWALHWYYAYRLSQNVDQMTLLLRKRKKILKEVMATETYVVAKEILEKYDPDQIAAKQKAMQTNPFSGSDVHGSRSNINDLRRRSAPVRVLPLQQTRPRGSPPPTAGVIPTGTAGPRPAASLPSLIRPGYNAPPGTAVAPFPRNLGVRPSGVPLPCPILPQQRGTIDRLVEFVVGDGPNNRYALVCRHCQSHNGMALREEFEYIGFRCCYCYNLNPARKQRPIAPRLPSAPTKGPATDKTSEEESGNEGSVGTHEEESESLQSKETTTTITTSEKENPVKEKEEEDLKDEDLVESQFDIIESQHERVLETINSEEEGGRGEESTITTPISPKTDDVDDDVDSNTPMPFIDEKDMKSTGNLIKDEDYLQEDVNRNSESDK